MNQNSASFLVIEQEVFIVSELSEKHHAILKSVILSFQSSLKNRGSVGGYFLAGRSMHFIPVSILKSKTWVRCYSHHNVQGEWWIWMAWTDIAQFFFQSLTFAWHCCRPRYSWVKSSLLWQSVPTHFRLINGNFYDFIGSLFILHKLQ